MSLSIVELILSPEQAELVAPLIKAHVANGRNALFVSTVGPDGGTWRWQLLSVNRRVGQKLLKVIRENERSAKEEPKHNSTHA